MKVVLVYDRVNKWGGAERDLITLHEIFPEAPLYTSLYDAKKAPWAKVFPKVVPSFLQGIPLFPKKHEFLGTLMPLAFESFDFSGFDLVISVTSEAAKGIITKSGTKHICICLTPTRYLWSGYQEYFKDPLFEWISRPAVNYLRKWDKIAAQRPDELIAISTAIQKRIKDYYKRDSIVIHPPIETERFKINDSGLKKGDFFLVVSRLVPYKKVDLAILAFNQLGLPLVVVGVGSEEGRLKALAKPNIEFVGELTDEELSNYYRKATALIFPQEEDFGKVVVEANAAGTPAICYKAGGALDTILEGVNGIFFEKQSVASLTKAIKRFEGMKFNSQEVSASAERFSKERFKREFLATVNHYFKENS